ELHVVKVLRSVESNSQGYEAVNLYQQNAKCGEEVSDENESLNTKESSNLSPNQKENVAAFLKKWEKIPTSFIIL
ncbi:MAG: hypothetical protein JAZ05_14675, partial [Candidatus Thiodiazotropha taylori]|nr:hypothetical protein [Candidatus Thiodiazotropha taylori]MCW4293261.1 hypothetical protein [Candidatus Thiodiazotropha taylori]